MPNATAPKRNASLRPRISPVGRAVLLLGICAGESAGRRLTVDGRRVQTVRYGSLALVVAFVDQAAYDAEEVARKRVDAAWLAMEARALERTVDRFSIVADVLPMKLLTVYPDAEALEAAAHVRHARWSRALARLGDKRECVVHVYGGPHLRPGAAPYVARVSACALRTARMPAFAGEPSVVMPLEALFRDLDALAISSRRVPAERIRGARFITALLLGESDVVALHGLIDRWNAAVSHIGLTAYMEGPRRPFSFVA